MGIIEKSRGIVGKKAGREGTKTTGREQRNKHEGRK